MKKIYLLLIFLLIVVLISKSFPPTTQRTYNGRKQYKTYLPILATPDNCINQSKLGIGWFFGNNLNDLNRLCASWRYKYGIGDINYSNQLLPMLFCDIDDRNGYDFYSSAKRYLSNYTGPVLVLNEPDRQDQCNRTPHAAAIIFHTFEQIMPNAKLIGPNISQNGIIWLHNFIYEYEKLYGFRPKPYRWAFHQYVTQEFHFTQFNRFCLMLESEQIPCEKIWITEFGTVFNSAAFDPIEYMTRLTTQLFNDPRIEKMAVFTNRTYGSFYLIDQNDDLTVLGRAYIKIVKKES